MGATINGPVTIERLLERKARLQQAVTRAEGERKASLEAEIAAIEAQFAELRAALEKAGV